MVLHLKCSNDTNGNPRRLYLVVRRDNGVPFDAIDEAYGGEGAWESKYPDAVRGPDIVTTPGERRDWMRVFRDAR